MARRLSAFETLLVLPLFTAATFFTLTGLSEGSGIQPVLRITGPLPPSQFGSSMANAGDFNGDGHEDLIICVPSLRPNESVPPHAQIYFGGPEADSIPDVVLEGVILTAASAGDMNGDGYGDIVVPHPSGPGEPQASVYFGGRVADGIPDLLLRDDPGDWLGFLGSAAAADFNGDGFDDILLAAPGWWEPYQYRTVGRAYLFLGGQSPDGNSDAIFESQISNRYPGDYFARQVAPAGDLNGDGFGDFLVTEDRIYAPPYLGSTIIYLGGAEADTFPDASLPTLVHGSSPQGPFVTTAGDLNADGTQDIAVQGVVFTSNGYGSGSVYVYFNAAGSSAPRNPDLVLERGAASAIVGRRDISGDGRPDLVIGYASGRVDAYFGGAELDSLPDIILSGEVGFGFGVSVLDWTGDGVADVAVTSPFSSFLGRGPGTVLIYDLAEPLRARGFITDDRRTINLSPTAPAPLQVRFEPVEGSYVTGDVDPASIRLRSEGTGEVAEISAAAGKVSLEADRDRNGVSDLLASFSGADLARLFSNVVGRKAVDVTLEGRLKSRRRFAAPLSLTIVGGAGSPHNLSAAVEPNPLNPRGTLAFRVSSPGTVTARLFDLHGRCVRTLLRAETLTVGEHRIPVDGRDDSGQDLASGVYFYRIDSPDGPARGRLVIAK